MAAPKWAALDLMYKFSVIQLRRFFRADALLDGGEGAR
jgi:hypothetical protein